MSLKSVEMQFALHKNDEVGIKQNQLMHKPTHDQNDLSEAAAKQTEKSRHLSSKLTETTNGNIHEEGHGQQHGSPSRNSKKMNEEKKEKNKIEHPYKGHRIDFSL